jgi:hypothetical protein
MLMTAHHMRHTTAISAITIARKAFDDFYEGLEREGHKIRVEIYDKTAIQHLL